MSSIRYLAAAAVTLTVIAACGDRSTEPIFPSASAVTAAGSASTAADSEPATTSGSTTTSTAPPAQPAEVASYDVLGAIFAAEVASPEDPGSQTDLALGGSPDYPAAAAITDYVAAAGMDLTGVEFWVFPVTGSSERLLIMEIRETAVGLLDDPSGDSMMNALVGSASVDGNISRFVMNYHGSDAVGDYVLTATLPWDALVAAVIEGADAEGALQLQLTRDGEAVQG